MGSQSSVMAHLRLSSILKRSQPAPLSTGGAQNLALIKRKPPGPPPGPPPELSDSEDEDEAAPPAPGVDKSSLKRIRFADESAKSSSVAIGRSSAATETEKCECALLKRRRPKLTLHLPLFSLPRASGPSNERRTRLPRLSADARTSATSPAAHRPSPAPAPPAAAAANRRHAATASRFHSPAPRTPPAAALPAAAAKRAPARRVRRTAQPAQALGSHGDAGHAGRERPAFPGE